LAFPFRRKKKTLRADKLLAHPGALTNMIRRLAVEAGNATLVHFEESGFVGAEYKDDGSPVTIADKEAEAIIEKGLREILPDIPMIGEEATAAGRIPDLTGHDYFWLVDPLDGTKEFISGTGEYTVNIALIHKDTPILGVVYAPVKGEMFAGHGPGTAVRWMEDNGRDKPISVRPMPSEGLTVIVSRSHGKAEKRDAFLEQYKVARLLQRGSSLKICAVASGKADIYPRFGNTCEWDTAAGDAVLRAAGSYVCDLERKPLTYGHADRKFLNPEFIAASLDFLEAEQA